MAKINWQKALVDAGGPVIKGLIEKSLGGGIKGKIAGGVVNSVLKSLSEGLGTEPTPEAIGQAIERDPVAAAPVVQAVEAEVVSFSEVSAGDLTAYIGLLQEDAKQEGILSRLWRPLFAVVFTAAYAGVIGTICYLMLNRELSTLNQLTEVTGFLTFAFVAGCAVLGVQIWQKSEERKQGV